MLRADENVRVSAMRSVTVGIVAMMLVLVGTESAFAQRPQKIGELREYRGSVSVVRGGIGQTLATNLSLLSGDVVITRGGTALVIYNDGSRLELRPNTRITISQSEEGNDVEVVLGRIWAFVKNLRNKRTNIRTGGTIVAIRGTKFEYQAWANGTVDAGSIDHTLEVEVIEGGATAGFGEIPPTFRRRITPGGPIGSLENFQEGDIAGMSTCADLSEGVPVRIQLAGAYEPGQQKATAAYIKLNPGAATP